MERAPRLGPLSLVVVAGACGVEKWHPDPNERPTAVLEAPNRQVDILFSVSNFMRQWLPVAVQRRMPDFMNHLKGLPGGLPSLHLGVVSGSMGAGAFPTVPGCGPGAPGNDEGRLQIASSCTGLDAGARFLVASEDGSMNNFAGDVGEVASCMLALGGGGCGFQQHFAATERALAKGSEANDPDNGGFLRPDANLMVVMITNMDDCSVPPESTLFDPTSTSATHPSGLGALSSYRCNEFGHLCDGRRPPHTVTTTQTLHGCVSAEESGRLTTVKGFADFLRSLKPGRPERIATVAVAGPREPYVVQPSFLPWMNTGEPQIGYSCEGDRFFEGPPWAAPGVRIGQLVDSFEEGFIQSACAGDFGPALRAIARRVGNLVHRPACLDGTAVTSEGVPECRVIEQRSGASDSVIRPVPHCGPERAELPCWEAGPSPAVLCDARARVCYEPTCSDDAQPTDRKVSFYCREALAAVEAISEPAHIRTWR